MIRTIKEIVSVEPYHLLLRFNTGELIEVDLEENLRKWSRSPDSKFRQLLNVDEFCSVRLDPESESVYWKNGIDLCPDVLYMMGQPTEEGARRMTLLAA